MSEIRGAIGAAEGVVLVSITTDPERDTAEILRAYAARFRADERWLFLTGNKAEIYDLANKGFKLGVSDEGGTAREPITHSTKLVLVDKNGIVRGFYEGLPPSDSSQLLSDIKILLGETR